MTTDLKQGRDGHRTLRKTMKTARGVRGKYSKFWHRYRKELQGQYYKQGDGQDNMTNYPYLFQSTFLPELVARDPKVKVRPHREYTHAGIALAHELALNQTIKRARFTGELRLSVADSFYAFMFMVTGTYPAPINDPSWVGMDPGSMFGDRQWRDANVPFADRISPFNAIWDDDAPDFKRGVYAGHEFLREMDSLFDDDRYDTAGLKEEEVQNAVDLMHPGERSKWEQNYESTDIPKLAQMVQLFVRPTQQLYTLVQLQSEQWHILRKVPFFGREEGPYHMGGYHMVPDRVVPLAPAAAWWRQYVELEVTERKMAKRAQAEKRGVAAETQDREALKTYFKADDEHALLGIRRDQIHEIHTGGVTNEGIVYRDISRGNLEYHSGVTDTRRGVGGESGTATEAALVDKNQNSRMQDMRRTIVLFAQDVMEDWGWYFHNDPSTAIPATVTSPEGLKQDVLIEGGPEIDPMTGQPAPGQPDWAEFAIEIDPSTLYNDNTELTRARARQDAEFILGVLRPNLMSQGADINMIEFTNWYARNGDIHQLESWVLPMSPMAAQFMQAAQQGQVSGQQVSDLVQTGPGIQSHVMNQPVTNGAIGQATSQASPHRLAMTPAGSNNTPKGMM